MLDRDLEGVTGEFKSLSRRLFEDYDKKSDAFRSVGLLDLLEYESKKSKGNKYDEDIYEALDIHSKPVISRVVNEMLGEHCDKEWIQDALYHKFKKNVTVRAINIYSSLFWDASFLDAYEMGEYWINQGGRFAPPPVPGKFRDKYTAYKHGSDVDISPEDIARDIMVSAYFRSNELKKYGTASNDDVLKYQKAALAAIKVLSDREGDTSGDLPEVFKRTIVYSDNTTVDKVDGYDPEEDSGYDKK